MRFEKQTRIDAPPGVVFAFHESPGALGRLTPPWERVELLDGGGSIRPGTGVELSIPVGPFRMKWVAEHTEYEPGRMFADRQVKGPFASWYHRHLFLDDGHGGTLLRDEVDYQPPLGALGRLLGERSSGRSCGRCSTTGTRSRGGSSNPANLPVRGRTTRPMTPGLRSIPRARSAMFNGHESRESRAIHGKFACENRSTDVT